MLQNDGPEAMINACIAAYEAVKMRGTSEMQLVAGILLQLLGEQIARQLPHPIGDAGNVTAE